MSTPAAPKSTFVRNHGSGALLRRGGLEDADHVAGRVAERAVPRAPRLVDGLLEHLGAGGADAFERRVEVVGAEHDRAHRAFDNELLEGVAVSPGTAGVRVAEDDG